MKPYFYCAILIAILTLSGCKNNDSIDLSGTWLYQLDRDDIGIDEQWYKQEFTSSLILPGSLAINGIGDQPDTATIWTGDKWGSIKVLPFFNDDKFAKYRNSDDFKFPYWLQAKHKYLGAAWYQKTFDLPSSWKGKRLVLNLERCHWESEVWINNTYLGKQNSLAVAHSYRLDKAAKPGKNKITIKIDNRIKDIDPGINAHSVSDHTQSNWNGIIGDISILAYMPIQITDVVLSPDLHNKAVVSTIEIFDDSARPNQKVELKLKAINLQTGKKLPAVIKNVEFQRQANIKISYPMGDNPQLWDEFTPNLYAMEVSIKNEEGCETRVENFGMIETKVVDKKIFINDRESYFRGTLECAIFPKTGFPPTEKDDWLHIYNTVKSFGLNHIRFHSWCPPEAAFDAADELGIYLQVEANTWATIGLDKPIDQWIYKETENIIKTYGNHPSFVIMVHGNEPAGEYNPYLKKYIQYWKSKYPRLLYAPGSGWPSLSVADVSIPSNPRIQRWAEGLKSIINSKAPQSMFDHKDIVKNHPGAVISHEIGQWCAYPDFSEIEKYDGVLQAKNFEIFRETLNERGLGLLADSFLLASGKLQTLCYKADIEALLRTKGSSGFQLLDLHDFPGQGTALVGVLNAFWEEKGYVTAEEYSQFCNTVVPLARFPQRTYLDTNMFEVDIELANYSSGPIKACEPTWHISNTQGDIIKSGMFTSKDLPLGNGIKLGSIAEHLNNYTLGEYTLTVNVNNFSNAWKFWVYPSKKDEINEDALLITQILDAKAIEKLKTGGKVLLTLAKGSIKDDCGGDIAIGFSSIFWNTAWTEGQAPHTLGILCNPDHKALSQFPTEYHSNWQWWDAMSHADAINIDMVTDKDLKPIVRIIDDWVTNRDLALIFEVRIGTGKLLVSGIDLIKGSENRLEAQQMLHSLKSYMASPDFDPQITLKAEDLLKIIK